jgi:CubicO group peptidase (beta-lactamase class C family)
MLPLPAVAIRPLVTLILLSALSACGGQHEPVAILDFDAADESILAGESTELSWEVRGVSEVSLEPGLGVHPPVGRLTVKPGERTRYRLIAGGDNTQRSAEQTVNVIRYDWSALAAALDGEQAQSASADSSGYSFALSVGGRTVFASAGGKLQPESRLPIAEAAMVPSAAAILTLAQQGTLDLDAPLRQYLGELWPQDANKSAITTRMLLNHSSGLPASAACLDEMRGMTLSDCVKEIAALPLQAKPGEAFLYSRAGYQVAGLIAEKISGLAWSDFFNEQLGGRLGLLNLQYQGNSNPRIGGGAVADAADMLKLQQLFLDGGKSGPAQLLAPERAESVKQDQIGNRRVAYSPMPADSALRGYSFGWWIRDLAQALPSRGPELGAPGANGSVPWIDFDKGYAAVLLLDADRETGLRLWSALRPLIVEQIERHGQPSR